MACAATCANGSVAPCVLISFSTSSSELAAQKWLKKRVECLFTRQFVNHFTKIRYQLTRDIKTRITNRLLPTKSLCAMKCNMPPSDNCCTVLSSNGGALVAATEAVSDSVAALVAAGAAGSDSTAPETCAKICSAPCRMLDILIPKLQSQMEYRPRRDTQRRFRCMAGTWRFGPRARRIGPAGHNRTKTGSLR